MIRTTLLLAFAGCTPSTPDRAGDSDAGAVPETGSGGVDSGDTGETAVEPTPVLDVRFLGVGGFALRVGEDEVLTAPLFSNPSLWDTTMSDVASDPAVIDRYLGDVSRTKAILSGHAHYDHLLDVPYVRNQTADATIYTNVAGRNVLAAYAPEPSESCPDRAAPEPAFQVPPDRVVAVDDPRDDVVDYRNCGGVQTCGEHRGDAPGRPILVPGADIELRALCSEHPDQFLFVHFGEGCATDEACVPVTNADEWLEGTVVAWLVDFLGPDGEPVFRVYYQDAPTNAPIGHPTDDVLAEKRIDLAILNAGNYEQVDDQPGTSIRDLDPAYVLMGHWEDFFRTRDEPVQPLPFMNVDDLRARLEAERPGGEGTTWWIPDPGASFSLASSP